jgi:DNA repair protein RadD
VYNKAGQFEAFDFIFVDEAHRIPASGEGKYRTFISQCRKFNPDIRVVGWTATPFRMNCGPICHSDHILNEVCYEAKVTDLISQGYLSKLRSKVGDSLNLSDVRKSGDYVIKSLAQVTNREEVVRSAVREAVRIMTEKKRRYAVFFCVDIEHCKRVSAELAKYRIHAPAVTGKTPQRERDRIVKDFKRGKIHAICNVSVFTEGFDAPHVDCVVLLRPTLSPGLFSQMVGRGMRWSDMKDCCWILDFANCIEEHGPIDTLGDNLYVAMATCGDCRESFSRAVRKCPSCGWEIPKQEVERLEQVEMERRIHSARASNKNILSIEPETCSVDTVYVSRWVKEGSPDSIRVQYRCGLSMFKEWVCLDHDGYAGVAAQRWYSSHVENKGRKVSVSEALEDIFLSQKIHDSIKTITVKKTGRHFEVIGHNQTVQE